MNMIYIFTGIFSCLVGTPFAILGIVILRKEDYADFKPGTGVVIQTHDVDYNLAEHQQSASSLYLTVEFKDDEGNIRTGKSNKIGRIEDVGRVRQAYPIGQTISFEYKMSQPKTYFKIFKSGPTARIHIEDERFPNKPGLLIFLPLLFGGIFIFLGILQLSKIFTNT